MAIEFNAKFNTPESKQTWILLPKSSLHWNLFANPAKGQAINRTATLIMLEMCYTASVHHIILIINANYDISSEKHLKYLPIASEMVPWMTIRFALHQKEKSSSLQTIHHQKNNWSFHPQIRWREEPDSTTGQQSVTVFFPFQTAILGRKGWHCLHTWNKNAKKNP